MVLYVVLALISIIAIVLAIKLEETSKRIVQLIIDKEQLKELIEDEQRRSRTIQNSFNDKIDDLNKIISDLQQKFDNKCDLVNRLNAELQKKTHRISALETDIADLQSKNAEMQSRLLELDPTPEAPVTETPVEAPKEPTPVIRKPRRSRARAKKAQQ